MPPVRKASAGAAGAGATVAECPVCFESFGRGARTVANGFSCAHAICTKCDRTMFMRHDDRCPMCRADRTSDSLNEHTRKGHRPPREPEDVVGAGLDVAMLHIITDDPARALSWTDAVRYRTRANVGTSASAAGGYGGSGIQRIFFPVDNSGLGSVFGMFGFANEAGTVAAAGADAADAADAADDAASEEDTAAIPRGIVGRSIADWNERSRRSIARMAHADPRVARTADARRQRTGPYDALAGTIDALRDLPNAPIAIFMQRSAPLAIPSRVREGRRHGR